MTTPPTHPRQRSATKFVCRICNGPCRTYKGTTRGWICVPCLETEIGLDTEPAIADALPMGPLLSRTTQHNTFQEDHQ